MQENWIVLYFSSLVGLVGLLLYIRWKRGLDDPIGPLEEEEKKDKHLTAKQKKRMVLKERRKREREQRRLDEQKDRDMRIERQEKEVERIRMRQDAYEQKETEEKERIALIRTERDAMDTKEYEERWKSMISVEGEGTGAIDSLDNGNVISAFVEYMKKTKMVSVEDLSLKFGIPPKVVVERIGDLEVDGRLKGVLDDRGWYICISESEMMELVQFIDESGKFTIADFTKACNRIISTKGELNHE